MLIVAIDPGNTVSAYLEWDGTCIHQHAIANNSEVIDYLRNAPAHHLFIEKLACMGQVIGREVLDTAMWSGRFAQAWEDRGWDWASHSILRTDIKKHHKAKNDKEIRAVMIQKYGDPGTKKNPGLTYGCKSHLWQAFALATWVTETNYFELSHS